MEAVISFYFQECAISVVGNVVKIVCACWWCANYLHHRSESHIFIGSLVSMASMVEMSIQKGMAGPRFSR